jgi:hypothetical protein
LVEEIKERSGKIGILIYVSEFFIEKTNIE